MQLQTDSRQRELKSHGSYAFPVFISYEHLSSYERGAFNWHWHPEIELTLFLEGEMEYYVNDKIYHLRAGDGLFCNSNALHYGRMIDGKDCSYLSITFHPRMIYGFDVSLVQRQLVEPILRDVSFASFVFSGEQIWGREVLRALNEIRVANDSPNAVSALRIQEKLLRIWQLLYQYGFMAQADTNRGQKRDVERIRKVLDYLHSNYAQHITLEQVADQMNLSRSESCRFFKKYMKQSVFDYLQNYRIEQSLALLANDDCSVTEAALQCGFASPAYFAKIFKEQMKCTPLVYRKSLQERENVQKIRESEEISM